MKEGPKKANELSNLLTLLSGHPQVNVSDACRTLCCLPTGPAEFPFLKKKEVQSEADFCDSQQKKGFT